MPNQDVDLSRAVWRKSSCGGGNGGQYVEVATNLPGLMAVRDSKDPDGPKLVVSREHWKEFIEEPKSGQ